MWEAYSYAIRIVTATFGDNNVALQNGTVIILWNADTYESLGKCGAPLLSIDGLLFSSSRIVAWGNGPICVLDAQSCELMYELSYSAGAGTSVLMMVDEDHLFYASDYCSRLLDLRSGKKTSLQIVSDENLNYCQRVAFSGDGRFAAWYGDSGMIHPAPAPISAILRDHGLLHLFAVHTRDGPADVPVAEGQRVQKNSKPTEPAAERESDKEGQASALKRNDSVRACSKNKRRLADIPDFADLKERG